MLLKLIGFLKNPISKIKKKAFYGQLGLLLILTISFGSTNAQCPEANYTGTENKALYSGPWDTDTIWSLGTSPKFGEDVIIPNNIAVTMSSSMQCRTIRVMGSLIEDGQDNNINITTQAIMINGGEFVIGEDEDNRYDGTCKITLNGCNPNGANTFNHPNMGKKVIGVMNGGVIRMHGEAKRSWTKLAADAIHDPVNGTYTITVTDPVTWELNDKIVITPSKYINWSKEDSDSKGEAEELTVQSVSDDSLTITLKEEIMYDHSGFIGTYNNGSSDNPQSWTADLRAEVGLLTKNIKIQGLPSVACKNNGFGGHIMIHGGYHPCTGDSITAGEAYVDGVELYNMGQESETGRYPFHWHMLGSDGLNAEGDPQYLKNSSIHFSHNRAITIHGTENVLVDNNFCYDHIGHGIFLEDGSERFNTIINNVVLLSRRPECEEQVIPSDNELSQVQNRTPASFWITNPSNTIDNNIAAGCEGTGFWFAFPKSPMGDSSEDPRFMNLKPYRDTLLSFSGNKAHSCMNGFDVYDNLDQDHSIVPNGGWDTPTKNYIDNCTWYANDLGFYTGTGAGPDMPNSVV